MAYGPILDQTTWQDVAGSTWTAEGNGLIVWGLPTINLVGDNPQTMTQDAPYVEAGATAVDVNGTDLTGDIVTDSSAVNVSVPGDYLVTYDVTDSQGYTDHQERTVRVLDVDRPDVRTRLAALLAAGMPDGVQVYDYPTEQQKVPAVVIGAMDWEPAVMGSLKAINWTVQVTILVQRSKPAYNVYTLETLSVKAAQLMSEAGMRVTGFTNEATQDVGGTPLLSGSLEVVYRVHTDDAFKF